MFRLSSIGHHQIVSIYGENYKIYGIIKYVNIKISMIKWDLVLSIKASNSMLLEAFIGKRDLVQSY
jgi:hypothetical protein